MREFVYPNGKKKERLQSGSILGQVDDDRNVGEDELLDVGVYAQPEVAKTGSGDLRCNQSEEVGGRDGSQDWLFFRSESFDRTHEVKR
jgi:hypothetical protein